MRQGFDSVRREPAMSQRRCAALLGFGLEGADGRVVRGVEENDVPSLLEKGDGAFWGVAPVEDVVGEGHGGGASDAAFAMDVDSFSGMFVELLLDERGAFAEGVFRGRGRVLMG